MTDVSVTESNATIEIMQSGGEVSVIQTTPTIEVSDSGTVEINEAQSVNVVEVLTSSTVTATQESVSVVTVGTQGPQGPAGDDSDRVPYTGADQDVDLGEQKLAAKGVDIVSNEAAALSVTTYYSGNEIISGAAFILNINTPATNDLQGVSGTYSAVSDLQGTTGTIEDLAMQRQAHSVAYFREGNSDANWIDGGETLQGYSSYIYRSGLFSGYKHDVDLIGHEMAVYNAITYNYGDGIWVQRTYGNKITVASLGVLVNGDLTRKTYGQYISVGSESSGTSSAYGLYIDNVAGANENYAIYSATQAPSYHLGQFRFGASTTSQASINIPAGVSPSSPQNGDIWFDGTNLKMRIGGVTKTFTLV